MGDSFSTQMQEFVKGFLCGFGLCSFAYFINAIYAIGVLEIPVVDALAREASSAVMIVVSASDGDSSSVKKYKMQAAMYMLASVLLYRGTLPKNDMKPSKNGWNCEVWNAGNGNAKNFKSLTLLEEHFEKHRQQIVDALGEPTYTVDNYFNDANYIIENGKYVS